MKQKHVIPAIIIFISILFLNGLTAGTVKYRIADIPAPLLKNSKAVVRNEDITVEVVSSGKLVQKVIYAITILNKNGESDGYFLQPYDKNRKVSGIKTLLFNESGVEFKKKGGIEILDYAMIPDGSTYADSRIKGIDPGQVDYPYTVEYSYEVTFSEVIQYPGWHPVKDVNIAVEKSSFTLVIARDATCRYYEKNVPSKAMVSTTPQSNIHSWELKNMPAYSDENYTPALEDISPVVLLAPSKIDVEGYEGNIETWAGLGLWINQLNKGRNTLDPKAVANVKSMVAGITDDRAKIKKLYEYMQNKTRYVNISVGIGGYQPFDAETVDRLSYGDCKALSNYMKSMLEVVGISSRYTLVLAGNENPSLFQDFPSSQFNHAILCVPLVNDTVWLECTSQNNPFNYMGTFTADRLALVIDADGGKLIQTPELGIDKNLESRKVNVTLDQTGSGFADVTTIYRGATYDKYMPILLSDQADRKKIITNKIHIPNFELDNFNIQETKSELPYVTEKLNLTLTGYCTKVGEKLMLCPNIMHQSGDSPFPPDVRKYPVSITWPVNQVDTVTFEMPQGYTMEKMPEKVSIQSDFGKYTTQVTKSGSTIQFVRTLIINKAEYPVEKYDEIVIFFDKVVGADEKKVMLTRML